MIKKSSMKKFFALVLFLLGFMPLVANAVNITVPSAPSSGYGLVSTTTGAYIYAPFTASYPLFVSANSAGVNYSLLNFGTTTASCSGTVSCSNFTIIGSSPITITGSGGGTGNVATSSAETANFIPYWTSTSGTPATLSGGVSNFQWNPSTVTLTATEASTTNVSASSNAYFSGTTFVNNDGSPTQPSLSVGQNTNAYGLYHPTGSIGLVAGGIVAIWSSTGNFSGGIDNSYTLGLPATRWKYIFATNALFTSASTTNATTTSQYITGIKSSLLGTDQNGQVIATTTVGSNLISVPNGLLYGNSNIINGVTGTAGWVPYYNGTNTILATSSIFIASSQNVGIGTTTPQNALAVLSDAANNAPIKSAVTGTISTNNAYAALVLATQNNASSINDGSGPAILFQEASSTGYYEGTGDLFVKRKGADNTGILTMRAYTAGAAGNANLVLDGSTGFSGIATGTPGSLFSVGTVANFTAATSTFYSTGGINLAAGCYAIGGNCLTVGSFGGILSIANGGTATSTQVTNGVNYFDGTRITSGTALTFNGTTLATTNASTTNGTFLTSFQLPNSSTQAPLSAGYIALDTTNNQLVVGTGGTTAVFDNRRFLTFTYATTTAWAGTTTLSMGTTPAGMTFTSVQCYPDVGTLDVVYKYAAGPTLMVPLIVASTTVGTTNFTSNNTPASGNTLKVDVGTPASSPTTISCTATATVTGT